MLQELWIGIVPNFNIALDSLVSRISNITATLYFLRVVAIGSASMKTSMIRRRKSMGKWSCFLWECELRWRQRRHRAGRCECNRTHMFALHLSCLLLYTITILQIHCSMTLMTLCERTTLSLPQTRRRKSCYKRAPVHTWRGGMFLCPYHIHKPREGTR
jgi:hypothetical protein